MLDGPRRLVLVAALFLVLACGSWASSDDQTAAAVPPKPPIACLGLGPADCGRAFDAAIATVTDTDPPIVYVQVGWFGCAIAGRCPTTLAARPEGDVSFEFGGGVGISVHLKARPDGTLEATPGDSMGIAIEPTSPPAGPGPMPFSLGHCGVFSGIDVDGSFWDPIGQVDFDHTDAINSADGTITFLDLRHATFTSKGGLTVALQRHDGAKMLPGCM